jgi:hypothetical protein
VGIPSPPGLRVVYASTELVPTPGRARPKLRVVTYDLDAHREVASFNAGGPGDYVLGVSLAGSRVVIASESRLVVAELDGSGRRDLLLPPEGGSFNDADASADGTMVAATESRACAPSCPNGSQDGSVAFVETASGRLLRRVDIPRWSEGGRDAPPGTFRGYPWLVHWRDDGAGVVITGGTSSEAPGSRATVFLDGRLRIDPYSPSYEAIAPNGRQVATGLGSLGCMFISGHRIALIDLDSGRQLNAFADSQHALSSYEWSPDGSEVLYASRPFTPDDCDWVKSAPEWYLLPLNGAPPRRITPEGIDDVHHRWYGDRLVTADCDNLDLPVRSRWQEQRLYCRGWGGYDAESATIRVGGVPIGEASTVQVVGFIAP